MNKKMEKCKKCIHRDTDKSNGNWNVCTAPMPIEVAIVQDSNNCEKFEEMK